MFLTKQPSPAQVSFLKGELESKVKQLKGLQADMRAMHADAGAKLEACEVVQGWRAGGSAGGPGQQSGCSMQPWWPWSPRECGALCCIA